MPASVHTPFNSAPEAPGISSAIFRKLIPRVKFIFREWIFKMWCREFSFGAFSVRRRHGEKRIVPPVVRERAGADRGGKTVLTRTHAANTQTKGTPHERVCVHAQERDKEKQRELRKEVVVVLQLL
jgi:hypothetical protein